MANMRVIAYVVAIFICSLTACGRNREKINLTVDGKTTYKIVLSDNPLLADKKAAERLNYYLHKISSATFEIIPEQNAGNFKGANFIYLGRNKYSSQYINNQQWSALRTDGIVIKTIGQNLILAGDGSRGTLYAVFCFLEKYLNCRWWTPESSTIPTNRDVILGPIDYLFKPKFSYRSHFSFNSINDPEFITILHENGDNQSLDKNWGGKVGILGWEHTFSTILPPAKYFKSHPEWYSDPANSHLPCSNTSQMPSPQATQLCMSDVAMQKVFIENALKWISENPSYDIVSISQNDTEGYCHCQACLKIIKEEGSPSGPLLRFVNKVAAEINKKYPNKKIETLSYLFSAKPPKLTRPSKNVIIRFAPIGGDFGYPLNSSRNEEIRDDLNNWAKISKENFFWGYNTNFNLLLLPHPSLYHIKDDLIFLQKNNFTGVFIQDNTNPEGYGFFTNMQSWVIGHLLWDASLNYDDLLNEFMTGYYGDAGKYMKEYFLLIQSRFLSNHTKLLTFNTDFSFITNDGIDDFDEIFKNALLSVKDDSVLFQRIKREKISLDYTGLYLYSKLHEKKDVKASVAGQNVYTIKNKQFFSDLDAFKIDNVFVRNALTQYKERLVNDLETVHKKDLYTSQVGNGYIFQQDKFDYYKLGEISNVLPDQSASDSKAASIVGTSIDWAVRIVLKNLDQNLFSSNWDINPFLKVRLKNKLNVYSQSVVGFGVYDTKNNISIVSQEVPVSKLTGENYIKFAVKNIKLQSDYIIWFGVNDKNNEIKDLLIDKVELTKVTK